MSGFVLPYPKFRAFSPITNLPLVGGKLYSYQPGTLTPKALFSDPELTTPLANPVILDSNGEASVYGGGEYDLRLDDADDNQLWTVSGVSFTPGFNQADILTEWISQTGPFTFIDDDEFSVAGDQTSVYQTSRRIRAEVTAGVVYGLISGSAFEAGNTTVTVVLESGDLDSGLGAVSVGFLAPSPSSIPDAIPNVAYKDRSNIFIAGQRINAGLGVNVAPPATGIFQSSGNILSGNDVEATRDLVAGRHVVATENAVVGGDIQLTGRVASGVVPHGRFLERQTGFGIGSTRDVSFANVEVGDIIIVLAHHSVVANSTGTITSDIDKQSGTATVNGLVSGEASFPSVDTEFYQWHSMAAFLVSGAGTLTLRAELTGGTTNPFHFYTAFRLRA